LPENAFAVNESNKNHNKSNQFLSHRLPNILTNMHMVGFLRILVLLRWVGVVIFKMENALAATALLLVRILPLPKKRKEARAAKVMGNCIFVFVGECFLHYLALI